MRGKIVKIISNRYTVLDENMDLIECRAMGKVRLQKTPLVGDDVEYEKYGDIFGIEKILERKNELIRPAVANIDQAVVVMSAKDPDFSAALVDRICFLIELKGITPVLLITKMDLIKEADPLYAIIEDYRASGIKVVLKSKDFYDEEITDLFKGKISVLTGQSGVGKSSMLNALDPTFRLHTQEISKALGRGKHTTRHTQLHYVCGGWIADTPGFSSLDFSRVDKHELAAAILDFKPYAAKCRFRDCIHVNEPGCAVKQAVENKEISAIRYKNYCDVLKLIKEVKY